MREAHFPAESKDPIPAEAITNTSGSSQPHSQRHSPATSTERIPLTSFCLLRS
jgi:hypothetical protein